MLRRPLKIIKTASRVTDKGATSPFCQFYQFVFRQPNPLPLPLCATPSGAMMRRMRIDDLKPAQLRAVAARSAAHRDWLGKLQRRMRELRFPADDKLVNAVARAHDAASNMTVVAS